MNAEEFQRRMRAEKQKEREQKNESAKMLQGYRGGTLEAEDALKQKAVKEEERKKQQDAENLLHSYQKKDEPEAKRKTVQRKDPDVPFPPVTVAPKDDSLEKIVAGTVSAKAASLVATSPATDPTNVVSNEDGGLPSAPVIHSSADDAQVREEKKDALADPSSSHATPAAAPQGVRFDLFFSFGILTESGSPQYKAYMFAVSEIVRNAVQEEQRITFTEQNPPYVANEEWDGMYQLPSDH